MGLLLLEVSLFLAVALPYSKVRACMPTNPVVFPSKASTRARAVSFQPCRFTAVHALVVFVALVGRSCGGVFDSATPGALLAELKQPVAERAVAQAPIPHFFTELPGDDERSIDLYLRRQRENASTSGRSLVEQLPGSEPGVRITRPAGPRLVDM